ncbi:MAG: hypothetical protein FJ117_16315 [Deltaproteobacteria bacterium]|nr:hypothetical protein [Deltaproteobacteria bacterium]
MYGYGAPIESPLSRKKTYPTPEKIGSWQLRCRRIQFACIFGLASLTFGLLSPNASAKQYSLTFYFGQMTSGEVASPFSQNIHLLDAYIIVAACAWKAKSFLNGALSMELEGQIGKYFGDQKNWEMNLAVAGRWQRFPWQKRVNTSLAWGIGPSYATEVPRVETVLSGSSKQLLIYWFGEITLGPPKSSWAGVLRIHHRSPGFGLFGTKGGANTLGLGLKYYF